MKNNHTIVELCGLLTACSIFPEFKTIQDHISARDIPSLLVKELEYQTFGDGMNVEQSTNYLRFVLESICVTHLCSRDQFFKQRLLPFIESYSEMLRYFEYKPDHFVLFGDEDNGHFVSFEPVLRPDYSCEVLRMARSCLDEHNSFTNGSEAFLGNERKNRTLLPGTDDVSGTLAESGHWVYRAAWNDHQIFLHFRCGPMEFPNLKGYGPHIHCDLLSFNLCIDGMPVFWDSGTYTYNDKEWRLYFRASSAHNTFRLEGTEQAVCSPAFASTAHPEAALTAISNESVEGRMHIARDGVDTVLKRRITLYPNETRIHFVDTITSNAGGQVHWFLNIHPDIRRLKNNVLVTPDAQCHVAINGSLEFFVEDSWYSPEYGVKVPTKRAVACMELASEPLSVEWDLILTTESSG